MTKCFWIGRGIKLMIRSKIFDSRLSIFQGLGNIDIIVRNFKFHLRPYLVLNMLQS